MNGRDDARRLWSKWLMRGARSWYSLATDHLLLMKMIFRPGPLGPEGSSALTNSHSLPDRAVISCHLLSFLWCGGGKEARLL
jgi:hypothetical protein